MCSDKGCIISLLEKENHFSFEPFIIHLNVSLKVKSEFHITLFNSDSISHVEQVCTPEQKRTLQEFLKHFNFHFELTDTVYFLKKDYGDHIRYSRIVLVSMNDQKDFEQKISNIIGFAYEFFPHITTHSTSNKKENADIGIGIQTQKDLQKYLWK